MLESCNNHGCDPLVEDTGIFGYPMKLFWVVFIKAYFGLGWLASLLQNRMDSKPEHPYKAQALLLVYRGPQRLYNLCMLKPDFVNTLKFGGN